MRSLRFVVIVLVALGSLGLTGICADAATCAEPAATTAGDCHERGLVMDRGCCCDEPLAAGHATLVAKRDSQRDSQRDASAQPLGLRAIPAVVGVARSGSWARAVAHPPPSGRDRKLLHCVDRN